MHFRAEYNTTHSSLHTTLCEASILRIIMASDCLFSHSVPDSRTVYSNVPQCDRQVDYRVTASRKRPSEVDLADLQEHNDLQENVWRDVDRMMEFSSKESQTLAEQLRRKRMKSLCTQLESLLPATPAKVIATLTRTDTVFQGFILYVQKRVMVNLPKLFSVS